MTINPEWEIQISRLIEHALHQAHHHGMRLIGVAVDDTAKRDYFVPRLRQLLPRHGWPDGVVFQVVPMTGGELIEVRP